MYKKELLYIIKNKGYCYSVDLSSHLSCAVCPISDKCRTLHIGVNTCPCCVIYRECWDTVATRDMKHKIALKKSLELGYLTEEEVFEELL